VEQGDTLSPLIFSFALEYAIRKVQLFLKLSYFSLLYIIWKQRFAVSNLLTSWYIFPWKVDSRLDGQAIPCLYRARRFVTVFIKVHYQTISLVSWTHSISSHLKIPKPFVPIIYFTARYFSPTPFPEVGHPYQLSTIPIRHIRSYPPYLEAGSWIATWGRAMSWWKGTGSNLISRTIIVTSHTQTLVAVRAGW
jgi:hypothetical protein